MADDLSDLTAQVRALKRDVERLKAANPLESASITQGRVRFIGGTLRVDSGGRVEIVGYLQVEGTTSITGPVTISGNLDVTGNSKFTGPLSIEGATSITGKLTVAGPSTFTGTLSIKGATTIEGDTQVTGELTVDGPWEMNGNGVIHGDLVVDGDMQILAPGLFRVGTTLRIDPKHSSTGAQLEFGTGSRPGRLYGGNDGMTLSMMDGTTTESFIALRRTANFTGVDLFKNVRMASLPDLPAGKSASYLAIGNDDGQLYKTSGVGGGGDGSPGPIAGSFMWPFSPSTTDPVLGYYGMRLNPVTGQWALHQGQDFSVPGGSNIPAAGDGKISSKTSGDARGNRVAIDHGNGIVTEYFHMQAPSPLAVGATVKRGDTIGQVGTTGNSTGNHLHWQTVVNGTPIDPRQFMASQTG